MGLFDFLFGPKKSKKIEQLPGQVWMTEKAKFAGIARQVAPLENTGAVLLVAHFPDVLARLDEIVDRQSSAIPLQSLLAGQVTDDFASGLQIDESGSIDVIVAERHPMLSADKQLEESFEWLPCRCRLLYHVSLEDPVLRVFAGDWLRKTLSSMGATDDECIESTMVVSRIEQAQKKIEKQARGDAGATSAAEWLRLNCPDLELK